MRFIRKVSQCFAITVLVACSLVRPVCVGAQEAARPATAIELQRLVSSNRYAGLRWPLLSDVAAELRDTYTANAWAPLWTRGGQPTASAIATIAELVQLDARGLEPADYDAARLDSLSRVLRAATQEIPDAQVAAFDLMLSTASLRSLRALQYGRVSARLAHADLRFTHEPWDAVAALRMLAATTNPSQQFVAAEPPYLHYRLLVSALSLYRAMAYDTALLRQALRDTTLKPGRTESVLTLRRRLDARVQQIVLSLERWRWLPHRFAEPPIIVNIPAFELYAFQSANDRAAEMLRMNVVVGRAYDHKTPVFSGAVRHIIFSPYWDVPPSIAKKEILPKARRDLGYLTRNAYEIVGANERVMSTTRSAIEAVQAGRARIRQRPGKQNALGGVKFIFPNEFNVYMHDTPSQSLFGEARRDFSHGCIRLSQPAVLAALLLRDQPGWDSTRIATEMHRGAPLQVPLTSPVPVHVVYATALAREDGSVAFYDDIYGHDTRLRALLKGGYPYPSVDRRP